MRVLERLEDVLEVRRSSFLDRCRVFSVRRGAQRLAQRQFPRQGSCFQRAQRCAETCAEAVSSTGIVFSACAEVRRDVRTGSFLDRGCVFSVRRGVQRRAQRQFPRQGSCFQRVQRCAETCAEAVSSTGVVFSACADVRRDVRRGSFLDRGRVFSVRRGAERRAQRRAQRQFPRQGSCFQRAPLNCFKRN